MGTGTNITEIYGINVFSDSVMRERLPKSIYKSIRRTLDESLPLEPHIAEVVASAMKDWAIEKGATHYTHWFQPMTGMTAEKHDSFISPTADGRVIMEFSGRELIKGETDGSSFPSGGLRATFEARGYTAWDCTSPAFVKDGTLYIPTAFCSHTGEALDKKTPLLRSMEVLNRHALRIIRLFGNATARKVTATVGAEQEYFLIDRELYEKRLDLILTGRTLFGSRPPKGQEMDDHYFGRLRLRVAAYMKELDEELWKLGISAKTEHNEVAPAQHELALIYSTATIACDHNQIVMEMMRKVAKRNGLACLLHEKPFAGVNGSGKHNNWSLATDEGENLLDPGATPRENARFLTFLCAVIKAVDEYGDLLRNSIASAGNDHRLGANEAPPAIVSIYIGEELAAVLEAIETGKPLGSVGRQNLNIGVTSLPPLPRDTSDRNRTSPFAFTGNKFEFRMCGSSASIAAPCYTINTIVAKALSDFAAELEAATDFNESVNTLIKRTVTEHKRIIFNGNNYCAQWQQEAASRGLPNLATTVDALSAVLEEKNLALYESMGVLSRNELFARHEIHLEGYIKAVNIEARTMQDMAGRQILPAAIAAAGDLAGVNESLDKAGLKSKAIFTRLKRLTDSIECLHMALCELNEIIDKTAAIEDKTERSQASRDRLIPAMEKLRACADAIEELTPADRWPLPTYAELLFKM